MKQEQLTETTQTRCTVPPTPTPRYSPFSAGTQDLNNITTLAAGANDSRYRDSQNYDDGTVLHTLSVRPMAVKKLLDQH
jgi:hypothetical protein